MMRAISTLWSGGIARARRLGGPGSNLAVSTSFLLGTDEYEKYVRKTEIRKSKFALNQKREMTSSRTPRPKRNWEILLIYNDCIVTLLIRNCFRIR